LGDVADDEMAVDLRPAAGVSREKWFDL